MKKINIDGKILTTLSLAYIYIPLVIFICGWTKWFIALLCVVTMIFTLRRIQKRVYEDSIANEEIKISYLMFVVALVIFLIVGYFAGYGRFCTQAGDWSKHNAVLKDLVTREWPVLYTNGDEHSMLTYYIAQYLVPALIGKMFNSFRLAEILVYVWNTIGIFLVYLNIIRYLKATKKLQLITAIFLPFFSVPLLFSEIVLRLLTGISMIGSGQWFYCSSDEGIKLQYSSNYVLLRWVFPQVIVAWLIVMLFLEYKEYIELYIPVMLPGILFGTLSFCGLVPIAIIAAFEWLSINKNLVKWLRKIFSVENIISLLIYGLVILIYLSGNVFSDKPDELGFSLIKYNDKWVVYLVFVICNIGSYFVFLWTSNKKNFIFYAAIVELILLPLFTMGEWNDLLMRASIPGLFILMLSSLQYLENIVDKSEFHKFSFGKKLWNMCFVLLLLSSFIYPLQEFYGSVRTEKIAALGSETEWDSLEEFANRDLDVGNDKKYNYFTYDIDTSIFRFISR